MNSIETIEEELAVTEEKEFAPKGRRLSRYWEKDWLLRGPLRFHILVLLVWIEFHFLGREQGDRVEII